MRWCRKAIEVSLRTRRRRQMSGLIASRRMRSWYTLGRAATDIQHLTIRGRLIGVQCRGDGEGRAHYVVIIPEARSRATQRPAPTLKWSRLSRDYFKVGADRTRRPACFVFCQD